jgi:hypothetical protein
MRKASARANDSLTNINRAIPPPVRTRPSRPRTLKVSEHIVSRGDEERHRTLWIYSQSLERREKDLKSPLCRTLWEFCKQWKALSHRWGIEYVQRQDPLLDGTMQTWDHSEISGHYKKLEELHAHQFSYQLVNSFVGDIYSSPKIKLGIISTLRPWIARYVSHKFRFLNIFI